MALYMDTHSLEGGVKAEDVAEAHRADLRTQDPYGVSYLKYWVDEAGGKIFCLVDAPNAEDTAAPVPERSNSHVPFRKEPALARPSPFQSPTTGMEPDWPR